MQPRCNITGRETDVVVTLTNLHVDELYAMECSTNLQQWSESARLTVYDDHGAQFTPTNHLPRDSLPHPALAVAGSRCADSTVF